MATKHRRTITVKHKNHKAIQKYRAKFLMKGYDKTYTDAVNELLKYALKEKGYIDKI